MIVGSGAFTLPSSAATIAAPVGALGVPAFSSFDTLDNGDPVQVRTPSGRADLVSGGDTFVEVVVPAGTDLDAVRVTAGDRDVSDALVPGGPGLRGLMTGLPLGQSTITATLADDSGARLQVHNVAQSGPVFSGPLIEPWSCTNGSTSPDCAQKPAVAYFYKSTDPTKAGIPGRVASGPVQSGFQPCDPADPPSDVAMTTTDDGNTVPDIVRGGDRLQPARPVQDRRAVGPVAGRGAAQPYVGEPGLRRQARPRARNELSVAGPLVEEDELLRVARDTSRRPA